MGYTWEDAKHLDFSDIADLDAPLLEPLHPGIFLLEEFLVPLGMSQYRLAKSIGVPQRRIGEIIAKKRRMTADTALRLEKFFGLRASFWLGLQERYDLALTERALAPVLATITPLRRDPLAAE
ncbi:HigA family addiction module antitoxin [Elstera cyanobacteriorum]|uniref:HigA family addiction module antitoxin n=1 Tax=Elstera cyanobacteriorum TaxID=2022747 RepID=UPI002354BA26|nr:HigA family addiction module antitoxin [Elstera cyanobacteriorum]MCK6441474.1 HigA family addiction module antitoxin [Elstera cyanobacteriorum]